MVSAAVMGAAAIGGTLLGGVLGGAGAAEQGQAQANMYNYKAGVALINQKVNQQNAAWAQQAGGIQGEETGLKYGQQIAQEKVKQASSGLDVNTGSNAATRSSMETAAGFDQNVIAWDAAKTSYGYGIKAVSDESEAALDQMAAGQAKIAGGIGETTSFLNAGTSVAAKWSQGQSSGLFPSFG